MIYPILITQINKEKVMAICPILNNMCSVGKDVEDALVNLQAKFICYIHDDDAELEIVTVKNKQVATWLSR